MSSFWNSRLKILKITILRILEISGRPGTLVLVIAPFVNLIKIDVWGIGVIAEVIAH